MGYILLILSKTLPWICLRKSEKSFTDKLSQLKPLLNVQENVALVTFHKNITREKKRKGTLKLSEKSKSRLWRQLKELYCDFNGEPSRFTEETGMCLLFQ